MKHPHIPLHPVESSQIHAIGWQDGTLAVQFKGKHGPTSTYHYPGVTAQQHAEFMAANSKGTHFGQHIRPRKDYVRVSDAPAPRPR